MESSDLQNGELNLSGFTFRYEHETKPPVIILRSTETGKQKKLDTEQTLRPDVNNYFLCEHDYTERGFRVSESVEDQEYEILIRWPWSEALSTGVYVDFIGVHYAGESGFTPPDVKNTLGLKEIVENGILHDYRPDYHCYIYQFGNSLYWIVDQNFYFEPDNTTYIQYQLYTTQKDRLPQKSIENGWFWDNIGGCFESYEVQGDFGEYRVMKRELPREYAITSIITGYHKDGEWIWKKYFRPTYSFSGDADR